MASKPLNRAQLAAKYSDKGWQAKLLDLLSIVSILRDCIIERNYKPSEELNAAILLTEAGKRLRLQLIKEEVNAKDANVLVFLALVHTEPLVDVSAIDLERLVAAISDEIKAGKLRHPLIFGRTLYDRASDLFKEEREYLSHEDTLRLLDGIPEGVFHAANFLIGPYGMFRTPHERGLTPTTAVPIQHCADIGCGAVHRVQLTTSWEAGVNSSRPLLNKALEQISNEPSEWNGFVSDITEDESDPYKVKDGATLPSLLGDAFTDDELRVLIRLAEKICGTQLNSYVRTLGLQGNALKYTSRMNRSELLQLILLFEDEALVSLLDQCVRSQQIRIAPGEIRAPKVNAALRSGAWRLRSEISHLGVRAVGTDLALPLMRLSALARLMFDTDSNDEMNDLAWALKGVPGVTPNDQLEEFLRTSEPGLVIEKLFLQRRKSAERACAALAVPIDETQDHLRDAILWKLGFRVKPTQDIRDEYWSLHSGLEGLAKTAHVDLSTTAEGLRATSSDYFVALERFLFDSLIFATWVLLHDHYGSEQPFVFVAENARTFTIEKLNSSREPGDERNNLSEKPQLAQLVANFARLASLLVELRESGDTFLRPTNQWPSFEPITDLQKFPFQHIRPFLDLMPHAQLQMIETLQAVAKGLGNSGIMKARNGLLHASQDVPTVGELTESLTGARIALDQLEAIGCVRSTFETVSSHTNAWGRSTATMKANGRTITFSSPSPYEWVKLPGFRKPHYLVQGAVFAAPNEMLRFSEGFSSPYSDYWLRFPVRPEKGNRISANQSENLSSAVETGTFAASRAG
ncbi:MULTISPECIES: hypothetical protein [unclassified Rathayibacter]|uniref:hypothetical protein n=1 Tax=unclassified Rathayibacter TaxID=2609250 RepID=UPI0011B01791|nr:MULTISPECIES: hypothetical protein [unclassified Rathayibacter]